MDFLFKLHFGTGISQAPSCGKNYLTTHLLALGKMGQAAAKEDVRLKVNLLQPPLEI